MCMGRITKAKRGCKQEGTLSVGGHTPSREVKSESVPLTVA